MNSPAVLNDIALTKQLSDGTIEWVPLKAAAQQEAASAGVSYTLIDRGRSYEAPQSLRLERRGEDLVVESEGAELLIITDFFAAEGTRFYPEPDIASGAGPFSGPAITPETETVAESEGGPLIVWTGASDANDEAAGQEAATSVKEGGISPWVWVGAGLGLLGLAGAAGGGGGGGGDDTPTTTPTPPPTPSDTTPPEITSSVTAEAIDENSSAGQVVYTAVATDAAAVTWSLSGTDAAFFSIDAGTGVVTLIDNPDFETQPSYEFTVVATDAAGNQSEQQVSLAVNDLNDAAPRITSGATATTIDENSGPNQAIYTATAEENVTWSLGTGGDAAQVSINASTGVVTLAANPDHETQSGFSFTVIATDADGNRAEQPVNLLITDLDEVAPTITSGAATQPIDENTGAGQLVYTATSTDQGDISSDPITYSLAPVGDATAFSIDPISGAVTLDENPNFETQPRYDFTVVATDGAGNSSQQSVSLVVNDVDDSAPFISSGAIANPIDENSGANQTIYTATAEAGVTWSLDAGANSGELSIDASTGGVTLTPDPDHETQADYTFTVIATDAAGNSSQQAVSLTINDLDEVAPTITSSATANAINENSGAGQVVYTATSSDTGDISTGPTQYSLAPGADAAAFSIAANSGVVTLIGNPDFETQSSYSFTVVATDAAGNSTQQTVSLAVNDVDENAPPITSGASAAPIDENSGADQTIYAATAGEAVTWSIAPGGDASAFSINASTGEVTFAIDPDHETQPSYAFTVVATNAAGNSSQQTVSLAINDLDEVAPTITSSVTATAITENSGAGQVVYTATSTDTGDISTGPIQYSLAPGADAAAFSIAVTSGAVTLIDNPDFEAQSSYSFTVIATDTAGNSTQQSVSLAVNDVDENAPSITSGATAAAIDENSGANQAIYTAVADEAVTWSLAAGGDASALSINASTGEVTLTPDPDHETQTSFAFTVVATNAAGNSSQQAVSLTINDLDEVAPTITSSATANAINENSGAGQVVYTATSTDTGDISTGPIQYSIAPGPDAAAFSIAANTGAVTLIGNPDFEAQSSYSFTVVATDAAGNSTQQVVSLAVNDVDENAPSITSGATAAAIDENSGTDQPIYTATASETVTWSLAPGGDASAFSINPTTGAVTLTIDPDHETQPSFAFIVVATNGAGNSSQQSVSLAINDLDEVAPTITSSATATAINENAGAGQVVYIATSTDTGDITTGPTQYSLAPGDDAAAFSIAATSGVVTLIDNPDFETQSSYTFTVIATDAAGNSTQLEVSLAVNDVDENAPSITSGATATPIDENSGADQAIYNATAGETVTWSLAPGGDASAFSIDASTGEVTFAIDPDHETQPSYAFTVVATNAANNSSQQTVSLAINDLDEVAPTITSAATATAIDENSGAGQVVYTATTDTGDISTGSTTYSLAAGGDSAAFSINANTGAVTLTADPDFEVQPSYAFTVIATDAANNSSQQAVTLTVTNLDEVAPTITSAATAAAIDENSGAGQVVYTATTDTGDISTGSTTYSLAPVGDGADFSINANTGAVTLIANPDFEVQPSYAFTVVATDVAGNSSQLAVTLDINDVVEAPPTLPAIVSVVLTDALGAENNVLNAGDTARVTVTLDTPVTVDVTGGTPQISLTIGAATVLADFVTGGSADELLFEYVIQAGDTDADGISIPLNAINANGGSITDALDNAADLDHAAVADNGAFIVDTTAPTLASSSPTDDAVGVLVGADIVLTFAEGVTADSGNITISDGTDTRVIDVTDATQVGISGAVVTITPTADLNPATTYNVQVDAGAFVDTAGNGYAGINTATELNFDTETVVDTAVVVFDLIGGDSSSHSGRQFDAATSYDIYILVDSDSATLATLSGAQQWSGADNLGSDDRIILVGDGADVEGPAGPVGVVNGVAVATQFAAWETAAGTAAIFEGGTFDRTTAGGNNSTQLFTNLPDDAFFSNQNTDLNTRYLTDLPTGILTSQGLV